MSTYVSLFLNTSIPILIACLLGYWFQAKKTPDSKGLAEISLYILSPCLIVFALAKSPHHVQTFLPILLFTVLHTVFCWITSVLVGRAFHFSSSSQRAMDLTTVFGNSNNYGLPILLLAFGTEGFVLGVAYVIGQIVLVNTFGLYLASRSTFSPRQAFRQIGKVPILYATLAGVLLFLFQIPLPAGVENGLKMIGNAYPAVVLLLLGMQLKKTKWHSSGRKEIWIAIALRILIVPVISVLTIKLLGIQGKEAAVMFVQSSMPSAINAVVLMEKYDGDKELVAITVALTTVASFLYLPLFIQFAGMY